MDNLDGPALAYLYMNRGFSPAESCKKPPIHCLESRLAPYAVTDEQLHAIWNKQEAFGRLFSDGGVAVEALFRSLLVELGGMVAEEAEDQIAGIGFVLGLAFSAVNQYRVNVPDFYWRAACDFDRMDLPEVRQKLRDLAVSLKSPSSSHSGT